jgi:antitoxin ParD1/3/4
VRDAIRGMQHRIRTEELRIEALRAQIKLGIDDLDAGNHIEVSSDDIGAALDRIVNDPGL